MAHDVFVSYSHHDKPTADAVVGGFEQAGVRCWIAPRDITPGVPWASAIMEAIEHSRVMVVVLSGASNASDQVIREVERALAFGLQIVPFRIEEIDPTGQMAYFLSTQHWLDALTPPLKRHIQALRSTVEGLLGDVAGERGAVPRAPASGTTRPGFSSDASKRLPAVLIGAALMVAAAVVGIVQLTGSGSEEPATTTAASTSITAASSGAPTAVDPTTIEASVTTEAASVAGGMVWTQLPGDPTFQRAGKQVLLDGTGSQSMNAIKYDGSCYFTVGQDDSGGDWDAAVWTSCDGFDWARVPHDEAVFGGAGDQQMRSVANHPGGALGLVAVGYDFDDSAVWIKTGQAMWSRVPHDETAFGNSRMESVTVGGPGLVAVGSDLSGGDADAAVWTSVDGLTWTRVTSDQAVFGGTGDQEMRSVARNSGNSADRLREPGGDLVAVGLDTSGGDADAAVWTSVDGITWTRAIADEAVFGGAGDQVMNHVHHDGCFQAVGGDASGGDWDAAQWAGCDDEVWFRLPLDEAAFGGDGDQVWLASWSPGSAPVLAVGYDGDACAVWTSSAYVLWYQLRGNVALFGDPGSGAGRVAANAVIGTSWRTAANSTAIAVGQDGSNAAVWAFTGDSTP